MRKMLSKSELLSYVRDTYLEFQKNDNYNDTFDNFVEKRYKNDDNNKIRINRYNTDVSRDLH